MTVTVMHTSRFALDPTPAQARDRQRHAGAARFADTWALAAVTANIGQPAAERSYGLGGDALTPALGCNLPALRRAGNATQHDVAPWWTECSTEAFTTGLDGVARAVTNVGHVHVRRARGPHGRVPPVHGPPTRHALGAVHHRHYSGGDRPPPHHAAPAGSRCPGWAGSRPPSPLGNGHAASSRAPPAFCPRPSAARPGAGCAR